MVSNANSIEQLRGLGISGGISAEIGGIDYSYGDGIRAVSFGPAIKPSGTFPGIPAELHLGPSYTLVWTILSW